MPAPLYGQMTLTGSAQQLTVNSIDVAAWTLKASSANAASVEIGDRSVTTGTGFFLNPGEQITYERINQNGLPQYTLRPSDIWVIGSTGDKVAWLASP